MDNTADDWGDFSSCISMLEDAIESDVSISTADAAIKIVNPVFSKWENVDFINDRERLSNLLEPHTELFLNFFNLLLPIVNHDYEPLPGDIIELKRMVASLLLIDMGD